MKWDFIICNDKKVGEKIKDMLYISKSGFVRQSNVVGETSFYKTMNFVLWNDEWKILDFESGRHMLNISKSDFISQNDILYGGKR